MELKLLGLARKPMFAVPNQMLGQISTELLTLSQAQIRVWVQPSLLVWALVFLRALAIQVSAQL
jgi:N12 class adenine-specific DNA methylase